MVCRTKRFHNFTGNPETQKRTNIKGFWFKLTKLIEMFSFTGSDENYIYT